MRRRLSSRCCLTLREVQRTLHSGDELQWTCRPLTSVCIARCSTLFSIFCRRSIDQVYQISLHHLDKRVFHCPQCPSVCRGEASVCSRQAGDAVLCEGSPRSAARFFVGTVVTDSRSEVSEQRPFFSSLICFEVQLDIFFFEPLARYGGCRIIQVQ